MNHVHVSNFTLDGLCFFFFFLFLLVYLKSACLMGMGFFFPLVHVLFSSYFLLFSIFYQLLKEKELLPELSLQVENIVCALDLHLQGAAAAVATRLREKGRSVDLVLESKPLKWYVISYFGFC